MSRTRRQFLKSAALAPLGTSLLSPVTATSSEQPSAAGGFQLPSTPRDPTQTLDVALFSDVEDIFSPPELGNDDSIKQLADILTEERLRANFLVIGDRAVSLRERRRQDVIDSLGPHEVGLHTRSARHPEVPEYVAGKSWDEAVAECLKREREGTEIIRDVFGKPCTALSMHYLYSAPHSHRVAAMLGMPFVYGYPSAPPHYGLSWYAGSLCLPYLSPTLRNAPLLSYFEGFDDNYPDDKLFEQIVQVFNKHVDACLTDGQPYLTLFLYHPQRLRNSNFIDIYWSPNGVNYPKKLWGKFGRPPQYSRDQVEKSLANFRRLARMIRNDPRLHVMTLSEIKQKYGKQPKAISREELVVACRQIAASDQILMNSRFSPAEVLVGMAHCIVAESDTGQIPNEVPRQDILGPMQSPIWIPELQGCSNSRLIEFARLLLDHVKITSTLPATFGPPLERVGINHLYRAFADVCLTRNSGSSGGDIKFRRTPPWPEIGPEIGIRYFRAVEGELVDPELDMYTLYRDGKLQSWTLKPASVI